MGGSSYNHQLPTPIIQVTRETLSSRAGAPVLKPIFLKPSFLETNFFQLATKILSIIIIIIMMIILFVTREEVPRLTVT